MLLGHSNSAMNDGTQSVFYDSPYRGQEPNKIGTVENPFKTILNNFSREVAADVRNKGFHDDDIFMENLTYQPDPFRNQENKERFIQIWTTNRKLARIALIHSELSEAVEGIRKDANDDKITNRKADEVELADALIRIGDYAGCYGMDLGGATVEKLIYNRSRPYKHNKQV